jgi:hypothetical protein
MKVRVSPESKRILGAVLVGLLVSAILVFPFCYALTQFRGFSVNTCHHDELDGKTNQEIADLLGFPLVTLGKIPPGLPDEPHVFINVTDTGCQLGILYGLYNEASLHLEIIVLSPDNQNAKDDWKCYEDPSATFETACYGNIEYSGKNYSVMLRSPYSLAESQNLTEYLTISSKE